MTGRLDDRVVLITGGARGQGAAEAKQANERGAHVVIADVADEVGAETAAAVGGTYVHLDVTSAANWAEVVNGVIADHGRIDGLVNNAGIFSHDSLLRGSEDGEHECFAPAHAGETGAAEAIAAASQCAC